MFELSIYEMVEKLWENQKENTICDSTLKTITLQLAREIDLLWEQINELKKNKEIDSNGKEDIEKIYHKDISLCSNKFVEKN